MAYSRRFGFGSLGTPLIWLFWFLPFCCAVQPTILKVGGSGAYLYLHDDTESETIDTLQPGEEVTQSLQTIGRGTWYLVRTQGGRVGWLRSSDVEPVQRAEPSIKDDGTVVRFGPGSTWFASSRAGRSVSGTWSGAIDRSTGTASGSWTVRDSANRIALSGTWSAVKSAQEWRGSWRALVRGQTGERSGTWSAAVQLPTEAPLARLFEQAVHQIINGTWQSAGQSGGWSIRAVP